MKVKRAYRFRFYPDQQQAKLLAQTFGCVRFVYNSILRYRTDAYDQTQERIGYTAANAKLTALKKLPEFAFLNDISSVPLQQCLRNQLKIFLKVERNTLPSNPKNIAILQSSFSARSPLNMVN